MAKTIRNILVAIRDLDHAPKSQLHKAAALAKASGAEVELFHVVDEADPGRSYPETATKETVRKLRTTRLAACDRRLGHFARSAALRGLTVRCTSVWDYPAYEAIIRQAARTRADLVIAASRGHELGARWLLLRNTDWELIRHSPVPVLLVKSRRTYRKPMILTAVDPFHAHARPANLDRRLLTAGPQFADLLHGKVHVFHAYRPLLTAEPAPVSSPPMLLVPAEMEAAHGRQITKSIEQLASQAGVPSACCHVEIGGVSDELSATARRIRADLVVMGAVSRSAIERVFIGNAAERVLDKLGCDGLIVKPRGLKSKIAMRQPTALAMSAPRTRIVNGKRKLRFRDQSSLAVERVLHA